MRKSTRFILTPSDYFATEEDVLGDFIDWGFEAAEGASAACLDSEMVWEVTVTVKAVTK